MTEGEARGFFSPSVPLSASNVHSLGCVCVKESPWSLCPSHRPRWARWESVKQSCLAGLKPSAHSYALNSANMQNLCYYHTDMKVTRKLFMGGQRARAVTLLQLFLHGLWSSLSLNRVHYSSPGFAKNGLFSQWPGVTYPTTACPTLPPHIPPPPPRQTAILLSPLWQRSRSHLQTCSHPPVPRGCQSMMDWSNAHEHCCPQIQ